MVSNKTYLQKLLVINEPFIYGRYETEVTIFGMFVGDVFGITNNSSACPAGVNTR